MGIDLPQGNPMEPKTKRERTYPQGPTEDQVDMKDTVPQHANNPKKKKVEDEAGTGEQDSPGG
jgi:hypothetical protein